MIGSDVKRVKYKKYDISEERRNKIYNQNCDI